MFSRRLTRPIAFGATAIAIGSGAYGVAGAAASTGAGTAAAAASTPGGRGSNARSGPAEGGSIGKVSSVSTSGFGLVTSTGQRVTVKETSSTAYQKGTRSASSGAVTKGRTVLVLGRTDGATITAKQIVVQPANMPESSAKVAPFKRGTKETAKQEGQIPSSYKQGTGTIVSGATANKATTAALAAYPGGVVDRVVKLSNGEYEVHYIAVNWPHHIFVNQDFQVVGADD
jgi:hypothetical protein